MAQTPLELLTAIAAPALITNASSVLVLSTSNRFARAVDRSRTVAANLAKALPDADDRKWLAKEHGVATQRTRTLVRALTSFYLAVGSFAFGSFAGLVGTGLATLGREGLEPLATAVALIAVTIGTLAIAAGAALLVHETQLAIRGLALEANGLRAGRL
jgi:threonine dehydratase